MISLKNIFKSALLLGLTTAMVGCSDMLESDSERQNFEPSIESKTDSVFYAYGIFEAMQHLADQYVFQGEMRGDLAATTKYTDNNLRQLANFSATETFTISFLVGTLLIGQRLKMTFDSSL